MSRRRNKALAASLDKSAFLREPGMMFVTDAGLSLLFGLDADKVTRIRLLGLPVEGNGLIDVAKAMRWLVLHEKLVALI
jgi:hypothetical protein